MIKNTRHQGSIGVASAIEYFVRKGYPVFVPLSESQRYDLVVEIEGLLMRIECKHSRHTKEGGSHEVNLRTMGGNRSWKGKVSLVDGCDLLYVLAGDNRYLIPAVLVSKSTSVTVSLTNKWCKYRV